MSFNYELIVNHRYDKLSKKDIYSVVREKFSESVNLINLNDQQKAAALKASVVLEELVLVIGPLKTSKTHLAI